MRSAVSTGSYYLIAVHLLILYVFLRHARDRLAVRHEIRVDDGARDRRVKQLWVDRVGCAVAGAARHAQHVAVDGDGQRGGRHRVLAGTGDGQVLAGDDDDLVVARIRRIVVDVVNC